MPYNARNDGRYSPAARDRRLDPVSRWRLIAVYATLILGLGTVAAFAVWAQYQIEMMAEREAIRRC